MPQQNVEIVRADYVAWEHGRIDLIVAGADHEIEIVQPPEVPDAKTYQGKAGVIEAFAEILSRAFRNPRPRADD